MFPSILKLSTWGVWNWQGVGPFLYFSPIFTGPLKLFSVFGFFFMHTAFGLAMRLGQFSFITACGTFALIPGWGWDQLFLILKTKERVGFRLFYLPKCKVCSAIADISRTFLLLPESQVLPVISLKNEEDGQSKLLKEEHIWISCQTFDGEYHYNMSAIQQLCRASPLLWPLWYLKLGFISNTRIVKYSCSILRKAIHKHGATGSNDNYNKTFTSQQKEESIELQVIRLTYYVMKVLLRNIFCFILLWIVVSRNQQSLGYHPLPIPDAMQPLLHVLHLDQHWAMFTPSPPNSWWWYNIEGELGDHTKVELWANGGLFTHIPNVPHSFDKPPNHKVYLGFKNHRWFKFFENGYNHHAAYETLRLEFGRWLCREYNTYNHGNQRLWKFAIHLMNEVDNPQHDGSRSFAGRQTMWNHLCYEQ
jgi:hypothetical protein